MVREQYKRCAGDPAYFLKKYTVIQHPKRGKIPFILFPFQEDCLTKFKDNRYNIVLKSRQLGLSTLVAGYALWLITFKKDQNILVIATQKDVAKNLITKIRVMYQALPSWLKVEATEDNKLSLILANGSQVKAVSSSPTAGRSEALSLLVLDEAAFIDKIDDIWTAAQPALSAGGDVVVLSTPNGVGNWFHETWKKAELNQSEFQTTKLHWTVHPERDQAWRDEQTRELGARQASQECDTDFLASGHNLVDMQIIQYYYDTYAREPEDKSGIDKNFWLWEQPYPGKSYVISADVARGDGEDYSAFHIFDIENMTQVAEYQGKIDTRHFGRMLASKGIEYNSAMIVVEREGIGWDTIQELINIGYPNLLYSSSDLTVVDTKLVENKLNRKEKRMKPGFGTTARTRPLIISKLETYFREDSVTVRSKRLLNELETFIWQNGRAEAMRGKNDDLVMSLGILLWVRDTALKLRSEGIELTKLALDKIGKGSYEGVYQRKDFDRPDPWKQNVGQENLNLTEFI